MPFALFPTSEPQRSMAMDVPSESLVAAGGATEALRADTPQTAEVQSREATSMYDQLSPGLSFFAQKQSVGSQA